MGVWRSPLPSFKALASRVSERPCRRDEPLSVELANSDQALQGAAAARRLPLNPHALLLEARILGAEASEWRLTLALSGRARQLTWELDQARGVLPGARVLEGADAQLERERCVGLARRAGRWPSMRMNWMHVSMW